MVTIAGLSLLVSGSLQTTLKKNDDAATKTNAVGKAPKLPVSPERAMFLIKAELKGMDEVMRMAPKDFDALQNVHFASTAYVWALMEIEETIGVGKAIPLDHIQDADILAMLDRMRLLVHPLQHDAVKFSKEIAQLRATAIGLSKKSQILLLELQNPAPKKRKDEEKIALNQAPQISAVLAPQAASVNGASRASVLHPSAS